MAHVGLTIVWKSERKETVTSDTKDGENEERNRRRQDDEEAKDEERERERSLSRRFSYRSWA